MTRSLPEKYRQLVEPDFDYLRAVERGMQHNEWVPEKELPGLTGSTLQESRYRLGKLNKHELIERKKTDYTGYQLNFTGYDLLTLDALVKGDVIDQLGGIVNSGKESVIYKCKKGSQKLILKLHREGYTDFREVDKARSYTSEKHHISWFYTARKAAERENDRLETLYPGVSVPEPVEYNRHGILMELVEGYELRNVELDKPQAVFDAVVSQIKTMYDAGLVHGDMSAYNVMVTETDVYLIDWPQSVPIDHPNADGLLERDIDNVISFFKRKYPGVSFPEKDELLEVVHG
ncbi:MAG: RIO1 family regulatory kinase/ATPase [Halobacteria archaeon]